MQQWLVVGVTWVALTCAGAAAARSGAEERYTSGLEAARAGDFESALDHLEAAHRSGIETPVMLYNLGVVHYRLGQLDESRAVFTELLDVSDWRALAHYNLGLIEERAGHGATARTHYRRARDLTREPRLRTLAEHKLDSGAAPPSPPRRRWAGLASLATGHDDNVVLAGDDLTDTVSDEDDYFGDVLAVASRSLTGDHRRGVTLDLSAYYRGYANLDDFDFGALSATAGWHLPAAGWAVTHGFRADAQFAGGSSYTNTLTYALTLMREHSGLEWRVQNELSYVAAPSAFEYLRGWRNRTGVELRRSLAEGRMRVGYELELNDRDDLTRDPEFFSYSPRRHHLFAGIRIQAAPRLRVEAAGAIRISSYDDDDRFLDADGMLVEAARDQDVATLALRADYRLTEGWSLWAEYQDLASDSDVPRYDYTSARLMIGVETVF